jgi:hypothetical protein
MERKVIRILFFLFPSPSPPRILFEFGTDSFFSTEGDASICWTSVCVKRIMMTLTKVGRQKKGIGY